MGYRYTSLAPLTLHPLNPKTDPPSKFGFGKASGPIADQAVGGLGNFGFRVQGSLGDQGLGLMPEACTK